MHDILARDSKAFCALAAHDAEAEPFAKQYLLRLDYLSLREGRAVATCPAGLFGMQQFEGGLEVCSRGAMEFGKHARWLWMMRPVIQVGLQCSGVFGMPAAWCAQLLTASSQVFQTQQVASLVPDAVCRGVFWKAAKASARMSDRKSAKRDLSILCSNAPKTTIVSYTLMMKG